MQKKSIVCSYEKLLRKAPAEEEEELEGFTPEQRRALTSGRFALRTPSPAPPAPPEAPAQPPRGAAGTSTTPPATHRLTTSEIGFDPAAEYNWSQLEQPEEDDQENAEWMETHGEPMSSRRSVQYRATRPGLRPDGANEARIFEQWDWEEGPPMRSIRVSGQPAITYKHEYGVADSLGVGPYETSDRHRAEQEMLHQNEEMKEVMKKLAADHAMEGTLTDGTEFLNLGGLAKHQADLIAKEYVKWRESGGGPLPDLSKYESPVARYKDGINWDYRRTAAPLIAINALASDYDDLHHAHRWSLRLSNNGNLRALDPQYIWSHIHQGVDPPEIPGRERDRTIFPDELKRTGLRPDQYPFETIGLINLGLHHQKLSRLHAEEADD
ncbi:MAG: hypothetical protein EBR94_08730 [Bacteroidetes bacterium]|nr:hypothetical protein [Bacteroidota bacterium]